MDPRNFKSVLRRIVVLPALVILCVSTVLVWQVVYLSHAVQLAQESQRNEADARRVIRLVVDMESGVRGYLLNGDRRFLQPYVEAEPQVSPILDRIAAARGADGALSEEIRNLRSLYEVWHGYAQREIDAGPGSPAAKSIEANLEGKRLMDAVRGSHDRVLLSMERMANERAERVRMVTRQMLTALLLFGIVVAIALVEMVRRGSTLLLVTYQRHVQGEQENRQEAVDTRELLATTLATLSEGVIATDEQGRIRFVNDAGARMIGRSAIYLQKKSLRQALDATDESTGEHLADTIAAVARHGTSHASGIYMVRLDGQIRYIEQSSAAIPDTAGTGGAVTIIRDITERRRSESALRSSERLALLGRLAATIAHEIRNPLDAMTNVMFLLRKTAELPESAKDLVNVAEDELRRIVQITQQLLAFNREAREPVPVDVAELIENVLQLFGPKLNSADVQVRTHYEPHDKITALPGELRQVFSNLVANAIDVLPPGGTISIRVSRAHDWTDKSRAGVRITIADNGPGIPEEARQSLFTPFFTTKGEKGTGLGLWVSRGIILKHEGTLRLRTVTQGQRRGTAFTIFLPETPESAALHAA